MTNTNNAAAADHVARRASPQARAAARHGEDPPLFQTPTMPSAPTTDFGQAHSTAEVPAPPDLDTTMPIAELPQNPPPKSWFVIIGGPFEGDRFGNYDREIRQDVERYGNCRVYGRGAGIFDEATASKRLRDAREQRVRDARESQQATTLTLTPVH
eukprot:2515055-Pleurochrysis_carterae.AAC.1